ncbi:hypothetical protein CCAN12_550019 [Capnocytophaga canimorsus]|uniref:Uncharacterized protein n=1 Tax=Capnocytophaga canimorsus TaxID=28188 RepID=A0A0B7IK12_9FLAO|nr:hypothetical protein CCAN12_550019 [Capnocytophaga canimorsus]CEN50318.1 hypothetical protein CCAN11_2130003 [Capnocytophaga canimorsus]
MYFLSVLILFSQSMYEIRKTLNTKIRYKKLKTRRLTLLYFIKKV